MKFSTMLRLLFIAGYKAFNDREISRQGKAKIAEAVKTAVEEARQKIFDETGLSNGDLQYALFLDRKEGPLMTAHLLRKPRGHTRCFRDLEAAGLIRLRSNLRAIVTRGQQLGRPGVDYYDVTFIEGLENDGEKQIPVFGFGDLSKTDQAFHYMIAQAMLGNHRDISTLAAKTFPPVGLVKRELAQPWPTDERVMLALLQGQREAA